MDRTPDSPDDHGVEAHPGSPAHDSDASASSLEQQGPVAGEEEREPEVSTDPRLDGHQKAGISGAMWTALLLGMLILVLLLVFILQNNVAAEFRYLAWEFNLPLGVAMLFAAVAGALVMGLVGSVRLFKLGHRVRRLEKEREEIKRALR